MHNLSRHVVAVLAVAALAALGSCGSGKKGPDCAGAIGTIMDRMMADKMNDAGKMSDDEKKQVADIGKAMRETMTKVCIDDKWSDETLKCINESKDKAAMNKCQDMLTKEQRDNADKAADKAVEAAGGGHAHHGHSGGDGSAVSPDAVIAKMEGFRDEMCKCKDAACANQVSTDMGKYAETTGTMAGFQPSAADVARINKVTGEMSACMQTALGGGSAAPAAPAAPAGSN